MKQRKLPDKLLLALAKYYQGRNRSKNIQLKKDIQKLSQTYSSYIEDFVWDKKADIDDIRALCEKYNMNFVCSAGTFFFSKRRQSGNWHVWELSEKNYLQGGKQKINKK